MCDSASCTAYRDESVLGWGFPRRTEEVNMACNNAPDQILFFHPWPNNACPIHSGFTSKTTCHPLQCEYSATVGERLDKPDSVKQCMSDDLWWEPHVVPNHTMLKSLNVPSHCWGSLWVFCESICVIGFSPSEHFPEMSERHPLCDLQKHFSLHRTPSGNQPVIHLPCFRAWWSVVVTSIVMWFTQDSSMVHLESVKMWNQGDNIKQY